MGDIASIKPQRRRRDRGVDVRDHLSHMGREDSAIESLGGCSIWGFCLRVPDATKL